MSPSSVFVERAQVSVFVEHQFVRTIEVRVEPMVPTGRHRANVEHRCTVMVHVGGSASSVLTNNSHRSLGHPVLRADERVVPVSLPRGSGVPTHRDMGDRAPAVGIRGLEPDHRVLSVGASAVAGKPAAADNISTIVNVSRSSVANRAFQSGEHRRGARGY